MRDIFASVYRMAAAGSPSTLPKFPCPIPADSEWEILRHLDHRIVHSHVAVRMIIAEHITDHSAADFRNLLGGQTIFIHGIENAAMHRLQTVANVRQARAVMTDIA